MDYTVDVTQKLISETNHITAMYGNNIEKLIQRLVFNDSVKELDFLINNQNNMDLLEIFDIGQDELIDLINRYIVQYNKVNLLNSVTSLDSFGIAVAAAGVDNLDMLKSVYKNLTNSNKRFILSIAVDNESYNIIKYIMDHDSNKINTDIIDSLVINAIDQENFDLLNYLVKEGIVTLDDLRDIERRTRNKDLLHFITKFSILGKRKMSSSEMPESKRQRIV